MFINLTNHPSELWAPEQRNEAEKYGSIVDYAFPNVSPNATITEICSQADKIISDIIQMSPAAVCCQGEMTLTYQIVKRLTERGIPVVAATSERVTVEKVNADGTTSRNSVFRFCAFRPYEQF